MTFLFGEVFASIRHDEAEVAGAGLVDAGEIDLVENAVTKREPNPAVKIQRGADTGLGARRPAGLDAGPSGGVTNVVAHENSPSLIGSLISSVPEDASRRSKFQAWFRNVHLNHDMRRPPVFRVPPVRSLWSARRTAFCAIAFALLLDVGSALAASPSASLDGGFRRLYDLDFAGAQKEFELWEKANPDDAMGPVSEAAGVLFSEFDRLGVLEAQFYEDDSVFAARKKYDADPAKRSQFEQHLDRAENLAKTRLSHDPHDSDALLAMTLSNGLRSDFAALIEKRNLASLHYTKEATTWSQQLLAADPPAMTRIWQAA